jgi:hypothetical protein
MRRILQCLPDEGERRRTTPARQPSIRLAQNAATPPGEDSLGALPVIVAAGKRPSWRFPSAWWFLASARPGRSGRTRETGRSCRSGPASRLSGERCRRPCGRRRSCAAPSGVPARRQPGGGGPFDQVQGAGHRPVGGVVEAEHATGCLHRAPMPGTLHLTCSDVCRLWPSCATAAHCRTAPPWPGGRHPRPGSYVASSSQQPL